MSKRFNNLFLHNKPLIACIHLLPLPGAPLYDGDIASVYKQALEEVEIFQSVSVDAFIIENFRDRPFYPQRVPAETIAALAAISREIVNRVSVPVGINVLRNDAESAIAIATAVEADFIRVNAHMGVIVSEQGIIEGASHNSLRLRNALKSDIAIVADVGVKHAAPLADRGLAIETRDLETRGLADAIIVSGELTGEETKVSDLEIVKENTSLPVLIGSGVTLGNIDKVFKQADGFIVGSYFKKDGKGQNAVEEFRVKSLTDKINALSV